jgi:hypothetical protein
VQLRDGSRERCIDGRRARGFKVNGTERAAMQVILPGLHAGRRR